MRYRWMLVSLAGLAACGGDKANPVAPPIDAAGYVLVSANGRPLPLHTLNLRGDSTRVWFGALTLKDDGTYIREQRDSTPQPTNVIATIQAMDYGTWTQRGDSVFLISTITDVPGVAYPPSLGVRSPTSLRLLYRGDELVFSRQ